MISDTILGVATLDMQTSGAQTELHDAPDCVALAFELFHDVNIRPVFDQRSDRPATQGSGCKSSDLTSLCAAKFASVRAHLQACAETAARFEARRRRCWARRGRGHVSCRLGFACNYICAALNRVRVGSRADALRSFHFWRQNVIA